MKKLLTMVETTHLMSTQANAKRLLDSIAQDRSGKVTVRKQDLGNKALRSPKKKQASIRKKE